MSINYIKNYDFKTKGKQHQPTGSISVRILPYRMEEDYDQDRTGTSLVVQCLRLTLSMQRPGFDHGQAARSCVLQLRLHMPQ